MIRQRDFHAPHDILGSSRVFILCVIVTAWTILEGLPRVLPVFLEHRSIDSATESVASGYVPGQDQSAHISEALRKAWSIKFISQVDPSNEAIDLRRTGIILALDYQSISRLVGLIEGVWGFGTCEVDGR